MNPYYNAASIDDPAMFFDRTRETDETLSLLLSSAPQSVAVVGQRKIGKSSFVKNLCRPTTLGRGGYRPDKYLFVHFDCQKNTHLLKDASTFYEGLVESIRVSATGLLGNEGDQPTVDRHAGERLEAIFQGLGAKGVTVIVIFDEFEKAIAQERLISEGFFGSLRGYTQANRNFAWVTCTSRPLYILFEESFNEHQVSIAKRKSESDFFNISTPIELNLFAGEDIAELITRPSGEHGVSFSIADVESILHFGGRFPYFVQRACYHFFNAHEDGEVNQQAILGICVKEAAQVWEGYWGKLGNSERALLIAAATGGELNFSATEVARLKELSLCYEDRDGQLRVFSDAFADFVRGKSEEAEHLGLAQHNKLLRAANDSLREQLDEARRQCAQARRDLEANTTSLASADAEKDSVTTALKDSELSAKALGNKLERQEALNQLLQKKVRRQSLYVRWAVALSFTALSLQLLFLRGRFDGLGAAIDAHPKRVGLYVVCCLIVGGIVWAIVDSKHWRAALFTILFAALAVLAQIL